MDADEDRIIIEGVRENGARFRPSDWTERISATLAQFGRDHRLRYATDVHPCILNGQKCLMVSPDLEHSNPEAFHFVLKFAHDNHLRIRYDRRSHPLLVPRDRRKKH